MQYVPIDRKGSDMLISFLFASSLLLWTITSFASQRPRVPHNNQAMNEVVAEFGQPVKKLSAVGQPPVTRWRYGDYTVYFEYRRVITTVLDTDLYPNP